METSGGPNLGAVIDVQWLGRRCWDWGQSDWVEAPNGRWLTANGAISGGPDVPNPVIVYTKETTGNVLQVDRPEDVLKGLFPVAEKIRAMVCYLIRNEVDPNLCAFLVKPLGATHMAFHAPLSGAEWDLVAKNIFKGDRPSKRFKLVPFEDRTSVGDGWRFRIVDALTKHSFPSTSPENVSMDSEIMPSCLEFYARNKVNGVRSEAFDGRIEVAKRKNNAPLVFIERRR